MVQQGIYIWTVRFFAIGWWCTHSASDAIDPSDTEYEPGCREVESEFSYFTLITYYALGFYFIVSAVHTFTYAATARPLLDRFPRPLQALHYLFFATIVVFPFITTSVYWALIYDVWWPERFDQWRNISEHALNAVFALFEIIFTRTPSPRWVHLIWLIVLMCLYLALAYVTEATKGFYVYSFLDPEEVGGRGMVGAWIMVILGVTVVLFLLSKFLIWLRIWITEKKLRKDGKFAKQPAWRDDMDLNNVHRHHQVDG